MESNTRRIWSYIGAAIFILTPLLSAVLFCAFDGKTIGDIYIPLGGWSDEITYYKQIESILSHGIPRGYFGFNQSGAEIGPFAYWGVIPLIPYVLWGMVFGWTYTSPVYANIFFCVLAFAFIFFLLRPDFKKCCSFAAFWIACGFLNRHVLSGVAEAPMILQLMIVVVIGELLLSDDDKFQWTRAKNVRNILSFSCTFIVSIMTIVRPYYAVFYLIPFWASIKTKDVKGYFLVPLSAVFSLIAFVLYKKYTCAAYFDEVILVDQMLTGGIKGIFTQIWQDSFQLAKYIWYAIRYHDNLGWYYIFLFLELGIMLFVCIKNFCKKKAIPKMYLVALVGESLILLSIMLLYSLIVGGRHVLTLIVVNAIVILFETHINIGWILGCIGICGTLLAGNIEPIPYADREYVQWMENLEETFAEHMKVTDTLSYDNVVGTPVSGCSKEEPDKEAVTHYGYLYAVPAGMGVSIDFWEMYEEPENIKAKYIIAHPDAKVRDRLEAAGMICVLEMEELVLYIRE